MHNPVEHEQAEQEAAEEGLEEQPPPRRPVQPPAHPGPQHARCEYQRGDEKAQEGEEKHRHLGQHQLADGDIATDQQHGQREAGIGEERGHGRILAG
ncbi:hypothetical protein D3C84_889560 [compost metagenome]